MEASFVVSVFDGGRRDNVFAVYYKYLAGGLLWCHRLSYAMGGLLWWLWWLFGGSLCSRVEEIWLRGESVCQAFRLSNGMDSLYDGTN